MTSALQVTADSSDVLVSTAGNSDTICFSEVVELLEEDAGANVNCGNSR